MKKKFDIMGAIQVGILAALAIAAVVYFGDLGWVTGR